MFSDLMVCSENSCVMGGDRRSPPGHVLKRGGNGKGKIHGGGAFDGGRTSRPSGANLSGSAASLNIIGIGKGSCSKNESAAAQGSMEIDAGIIGMDVVREAEGNEEMIMDGEAQDLRESGNVVMEGIQDSNPLSRRVKDGKILQFFRSPEKTKDAGKKVTGNGDSPRRPGFVATSLASLLGEAQGFDNCGNAINKVDEDNVKMLADNGKFSGCEIPKDDSGKCGMEIEDASAVNIPGQSMLREAVGKHPIGHVSSTVRNCTQDVCIDAVSKEITNLNGGRNNSGNQGGNNIWRPKLLHLKMMKGSAGLSMMKDRFCLTLER